MKNYISLSFLILSLSLFLTMSCGKKVVQAGKKETVEPMISNEKAAPFKFTDANFEASALGSGVSVVDFWAEWCGPCRMITPIIEDLSKKYEGQAIIGKLNVDFNGETARKYGIRSIPTILVLKDGEIFHKHVGVITKSALASKIDEALGN